MKAAFIGLGTMGQGMAANILKAGHELKVYNRTAAKAGALAKAGAVVTDTPAQAAKEVEVIVSCVSDTPDVEEVLLGNEGVVHGAAPGAVVVDTSTISPEATRGFAQALAQKEIRMIDAPVSGGSEGAEQGTLAIMVGGEAADVDQAYPILDAMGKTITHVGPIGSGQVTKAINQIIIAGVYWAVGEGMALGIKAGLDMDQVVTAIAGGAAGSWVLTNRAGNMIKNDYPLGFRLKLHRKDLGIALDAAQELGVSMPLAAAVAQAENGLIAMGHGDEDVSALFRGLRKSAGIE